MSFSDRILGKKNANGGPHIESVSPVLALTGGEVRIAGSGLRPPQWERPQVQFGDVQGSLVVSSDSFLIARVPEGATSGPVMVATDGHVSNPHPVKVAVPIAENLHPVTSPGLDPQGNIYVTFSGSRGQKVPVAIFKIDTNYAVKPFVGEMMNATAIAFDRQGQMYVSSRHDGAVYRVAPNGTMTTYAEGMGIATGIAFDRNQNLYVGDRSGTIFKIGRD
jgi:sugar lactone lactonase YvrE